MPLYIKPTGIEKFLDSFLLGSHPYYLIACPDEYSRNFTKLIEIYYQSDIVKGQEIAAAIISDQNLNFYFSLFAGACLVLALALNRKQFIQSSTLRLFTNYYIGVLLGQTFLNLLANFFIIFFPVGSKNGLCKISIAYYEVMIAPKRELNLSRLQTYASTLSIIFNSLAYHLLPIYLIIHRLTTYFACAFPFAFKRYFGTKRLMLYYPLIGSILFVYHVTYNIISLKFQRSNEYWDFFDGGYLYKRYEYINQIATTTFVLMHLVITVICIYAILKFSNSTPNEMKELRSFLAFSIAPTAISILFQCISFINGSSWVFDARDRMGVNGSPFMILMSNIESILLIVFQPLYTCILYIIFVPSYRILFYRLFFCCKPRNVQIHPIVILSVSRNI